MSNEGQPTRQSSVPVETTRNLKFTFDNPGKIASFEIWCKIVATSGFAMFQTTFQPDSLTRHPYNQRRSFLHVKMEVGECVSKMDNVNQVSGLRSIQPTLVLLALNAALKVRFLVAFALNLHGVSDPITFFHSCYK